MALNEFGYQRATVDVDVLLTVERLEAFKARHLGRGYVEKFPGSRGLRDLEHGVDVDIVLAGSYPGDGHPKPVAFPDPSTAAAQGTGIALLPLPTLIELKLASGMTAPHRLKDLADVLELIRVLKLPAELSTELNPYVHDKYVELWRAAQTSDSEQPRPGASCAGPGRDRCRQAVAVRSHRGGRRRRPRFDDGGRPLRDSRRVPSRRMVDLMFSRWSGHTRGCLQQASTCGGARVPTRTASSPERSPGARSGLASFRVADHVA